MRVYQFKNLGTGALTRFTDAPDYLLRAMAAGVLTPHPDRDPSYTQESRQEQARIILSLRAQGAVFD